MNRDILLVSAFEIDRWGLCALSNPVRRCRFHSVYSLQAISELLQNATPDLALIDLEFLPHQPLDCIHDLRTRHPNLPTLLLSRIEHPQIFLRAANLGVLGAISKTEKPEEIWKKFETGFRGEVLWTRDELRRLAVCSAALPPERVCCIPLTIRERDVLTRLANGYSNRQIADELKISYETVKEHVQHILRKLSVTDRTQAAVWAVRNKIVANDSIPTQLFGYGQHN
jgi:DNA-binding NarL/FixJ family response regulator